MAVPDYETLMKPTLAALADGNQWTLGQLRDAVAPVVGIAGADLEAMLPSGKETVFGSRVGWALTYMSQAGLVTRPKRGVYVITERGKHVLSTHPERVDNKVLEQFPEFLEFKNRRSEKGEPVGTHGEPQAPSVASLSPTEAITRLVSDADDAVAAELLDRVLAQPPAFLERLSLRLLQAMGYGGKEALLTHTGTSLKSQAMTRPAGGSRASTPGPLNATLPAHFHPGQNSQRLPKVSIRRIAHCLGAPTG